MPPVSERNVPLILDQLMPLRYCGCKGATKLQLLQCVFLRMHTLLLEITKKNGFSFGSLQTGSGDGSIQLLNSHQRHNSTDSSAT